MARLGCADDFGPLCAFLCSRHAGYITAQNIAVDGGLVRGLL
jgi:3-oxoacyl-[acyl-carrier protein] reductase